VLKKAEPAVDLQNSQGITLPGDDFEDLLRHPACGFGSAWAQAIKDKGDEVLRSGSCAEGAKGRESNGRSVVGDHEL